MSNENDPKAIREEIEATRERISDTAEALAYKSDVPARVKEKVSARVDDIKAKVSDTAASVSSKLSDASGAAKSNMHDLSETAKSSLGNAADSARSAADSARSAVGSATDAAKERLANSQSSGSDLAQRLRDNVGSTDGDSGGPFGGLVANPLALGIASIAAGFLVGLAIPVSDVERENVGPLGERVASEAKAKASDLAEQGKAAVVSAVTDTFTQSSTSKAGP